jgi:hypothetical protein
MPSACKGNGWVVDGTAGVINLAIDDGNAIVVAETGRHPCNMANA